MDQTNGVNTPFDETDKKSLRDKTNDQLIVEHADTFLSENDDLSDEELLAVSQENTPEAQEKILEIAEQNDITVNDGEPLIDVAYKIINSRATQDSPDYL